MRRARGRLAETVLEASRWREDDLVDRRDEGKNGEGTDGGGAKDRDAEEDDEASIAASGEGGDAPSPAAPLSSSRARRIPSHLWHARRFAMGYPFPGLQWRLPIAAFAARTRKVRTAGAKLGGEGGARKRKGRGATKEDRTEEAGEATGDGSAEEEKGPRSGEEEETAEPMDPDEGSPDAASSGGGVGGKADDAAHGSPGLPPGGSASGLVATADSSVPRFPRCTVHDGGYYCAIALDAPGAGTADEAALEVECPLIRKLIALCGDASAENPATPSAGLPSTRFVSCDLAPGIAATAAVGPGKSEPASGSSASSTGCTLWAHAAVAAPLWRTLAASRALAGSAPRPLPLGLLQLRGTDADEALAWLAGEDEEGERAVESAQPRGPRVYFDLAAARVANGEATWVRLCDPRLRGLPASLRGSCREGCDDEAAGDPAESASATFGRPTSSSALSPPTSLEVLSRGPGPHPEALVSALRQRCRLRALGAYEMPDGVSTDAELARDVTEGEREGISASPPASPPTRPPFESAPWTWGLATRVARSCPLPAAVLPRLEGWDVALPLRWIAPLLAALASRGAEVAGQERWQDVHAASGAAWFDGRTEVDVVRRMLGAKKDAAPSPAGVHGVAASTAAASEPRKGEKRRPSAAPQGPGVRIPPRMSRAGLCCGPSAGEIPVLGRRSRFRARRVLPSGRGPGTRRRSGGAATGRGARGAGARPGRARVGRPSQARRLQHPLLSRLAWPLRVARCAWPVQPGVRSRPGGPGHWSACPPRRPQRHESRWRSGWRSSKTPTVTWHFHAGWCS